jgi:hypothetical protein
MTRDDAIAYGFRLAWKGVPLAMVAVVVGFLSISALGNFFDQIEAANAFRRIAG